MTVTNEEIARGILDAASYVVLATADADGVPWASPVWFAMEDYRELFWVSFPGARHSQNIAARPLIAMVVFDSSVPPGTGQGVYMSATAQRVTDLDDLTRGVAVFSRRSLLAGSDELDAEQVSGGARLRLYRAHVHEHSILDPDSPYDVRVTVAP
jgi:nitroimidazol reductase NimA-like FMN-containing flavoprotein (pyridoxamine 5'-phosphate oxidase superfamily)